MSAGCTCGRATPYTDCCGRLHDRRAAAITAEQLMRSRYSAYVLHDAAYLQRTWSPDTRPSDLRLDDRLRWTGLDIVGSTGGSAFHATGTVEFRARYVRDGRRGEQHEDSEFVRANGVWVYLGPVSSS